MKKAIIITGATGTIGRALIEEAGKQQYHVLAIVHRNSKRADALKQYPYVTVMQADIEEYPKVPEMMELIDETNLDYRILFHLAWNGTFGDSRNDVMLQEKNIKGALEAVKIAKLSGCEAFVGAGSQAEYGRVDGILKADTPAFPESGYGITKLCAGQLTRLLADQLGIRHEWVRILSIYGPYDGSHTLISSAIRCMLAGEYTSFTPGEQIWDYLYNKDAARAMLLAGERGKDKAVYPIGSGKAYPLKDYIREIAEIIGYEKKLGFGKRPYNDKQVMYLQADISQLQKDTGFTPHYSFMEGIRETIDYWKSVDRI